MIQPEESETQTPADAKADRIKQASNDLAGTWRNAQQAAGLVNQSRFIIPLAINAIKFIYALLGIGLPTLITGIFIIVILSAIAAFFIYFTQPNIKARILGTLGLQQENPQNSIDRRNLLTVQSAAGLISNLQQDLASSRGTDLQLESATDQIKKSANIADEKKQPLIDGLNNMATLAKKIRLSANEDTKNNLIQELHTQSLHYEFLVADTLLPGGAKRLHVPWRNQLPASKTCNYYAAEMVVLYHRYQSSSDDESRRSYPVGLEDTLTPGRKICLKNTQDYL
ncbi:hypothetical protein HY065_01375, partial [Candidatus Berkelbacteria bacterium]|nr:hypothetical protein [Candidatus Berkelbacteria bacterium]